MRSVISHEARQAPSWLIFDVGQNMDHCYVEFSHQGGAELLRLRDFVVEVEKGKSLPAGEGDRAWIQFFTEDQLSGFWWPSSDEEQEVRRAWGDVPVFRTTQQKKERDWDIYSLFEVLRESEYELVGVSPVHASLYRIEFDPAAYPFGGTDSLQRLVRAFGGLVVAVDDGTGREEAVSKR